MKLRIVTALLLALPLAAVAKNDPPPLADVKTYPAQETHDNEKVTIAADPFDTRARANFFRIDYVGHSILPIRVIIRNDSDHPLSLSDVRIQFEPAHGARLPAAFPDEINRRVFHIKNPTTIRKSPFPSFSTPVDKKILQDDQDFSLKATTIAPHSTVSGFLFYDIDNIDDDPPLKGADLYIKMIRAADTKAELFPFTLSFDKYLAAKPKAETKTDTKDAEKK
jgi:hypothetical protein